MNLESSFKNQVQLLLASEYPNPLDPFRRSEYSDNNYEPSLQRDDEQIPIITVYYSTFDVVR